MIEQSEIYVVMQNIYELLLTNISFHFLNCVQDNCLESSHIVIVETRLSLICANQRNAKG